MEDGYSFDSNGRWHRDNGQFASYDEVGIEPKAKAPKNDNSQDLPSSSTELHRPYIRKSTRKAVEDAADRAPDGRFLDANEGFPIDGKYDLGHKYSHEFWREKKAAESKGWTQKQFNDYMNNPEFYQIEHPSVNRSRKHEMK